MTAGGALRVGFFPVEVDGERFLLYEIGSADAPYALGIGPLEAEASAACGRPLTGGVSGKTYCATCALKASGE